MPDILRDLGDGLILRRARPADREAVADFHANTLLAPDETPPLERLRAWILDLMGGQHPAFDPADFTIVEDVATGKIVSSMALLSQTWTYAGVPFPFGQPDAVSTDPAYRRRGLVRAQMEEVHRWSAERGELVQGITGIPWFYRQFGYEMALDLDAGRACCRPDVPRLKEGEAEPCILRPATAADIPFVMAMYEQAMSRSALAVVRGEPLWRFDLEGRSAASGMRRVFRVIEATEAPGDPVGVLIHRRRLSGATLDVLMFEAAPGTPMLTPTASVLRYLDAAGTKTASRDGTTFETIAFMVGREHPVFDAAPNRLTRVVEPYAWYLRVPNLPAFLRRIAPALERRLAESPQAGYTGELKISFYRGGVRLGFDAGRLSVEAWTPEDVEDGDAAFPDLTFLQLLFGRRSPAELQHAFPDCLVERDAARALLPILFPKTPSDVWSGG